MDLLLKALQDQSEVYVVYFSGYIFLTYAYNMMTGLKMRGPHFLSLGLPSC